MTMSSNSTESASRIPVTLRRSASLRQKGERCYMQQQQQRQQQQQPPGPFPAIRENAEVSKVPAALKRASSSSSLRPARLSHDDCGASDVDSVRSFGSNCSQYSAASGCEHAHFGFNGTTWSGRSRRYIVHCSPREGRSAAVGAGDAADSCASPEHYLTPTQRAARQLRNVQALLKETRQRLEQRDQEIARLTKELVELRLFKAALGSDDAEAEAEADKPPAVLAPPAAVLDGRPVASPLVDSGHFEDGSLQVLQSRERERVEASSCHFERRIDEMQRRHVDELQQLKQAHHDRLEGLLSQLAEVSTRYCETQPALEQAKARSRQLEAELQELGQQLRQSQAELAEQDERNKQTYLEVYAKGQQAARIEQQQRQQQDLLPCDGDNPSPTKVTVAELLQQLTVTQAELDNVKPFQDSCYAPERLMTLACRSQALLSLQEAVSLWVLGTRKAMYRRILESRNKQNALDPEITLQFLKSAIYYFLTDKENLHGHLNAIESILGFTDSEKLNIDRIYRPNKK